MNTPNIGQEATETLESFEQTCAQLTTNLRKRLEEAVFMGAASREGDGIRLVFDCGDALTAVVSHQPEYERYGAAVSVKFWITSEFEDDAVGSWRYRDFTLMSAPEADLLRDDAILLLQQLERTRPTCRCQFLRSGHIAAMEQDRTVLSAGQMEHMIVKMIRAPAEDDVGCTHVKYSRIPLREESPYWSYTSVELLPNGRVPNLTLLKNAISFPVRGDTDGPL